MPRKIHNIIIALSLLAPAALSSATAEDHLPFYGGFALGFASASGSNCDYYGYNCDGTDTTFKIYAGKRLHENLAVEFAYYDLGKLTNKGTLVTTSAQTQALNLSLLGIIPLTDVGYFYGKAGVTATDTDITRSGADTGSSSESGSDFSYGAGFAYTFGKYDFRIEYERLYELGDDFVPGGSAVTVLNFAGTIYFH
jgi:OOP family OmpA-OmpF porin